MAHAVPVVLTVNSGSSSLKIGLFDASPSPALVSTLTVNGIGSARPTMTVGSDREPVAIDPDGDDPLLPATVVAALTEILGTRSVVAIAHRIVHGGSRFDRTVPIDDEVTTSLAALVPLAPNHLPQELRLIERVAHAFPGVPQFACFDTAFHRDLPEVSRILPIAAPPDVRRYGFHGLSYTFVLGELERIAGPAAARGRVVLAHLGNGASLAAVLDRRCIDTTMGLTPTGGVVMSSRTGDLDPGVLTYLLRTGTASADLEKLVTQRSGLRAISGGSSDLRELLEQSSSDPRARLAVEVFCYQVRKAIGAFAAALGGLDTLVFCGGIGEHLAEVRAQVCASLAFLGITLDPERNRHHSPIISADRSTPVVRVIPTDEALVMARETIALLHTRAQES